MANTFLRAVLTAVDHLSPSLRRINQATRVARHSLVDLGKSTGHLMDTVGKPLALIGGAAGIGGLVAGANGVVGVSAQFEKFGTTLEIIEGSAEKAKASMAWIQSFAMKTPYELAGVTDAFVKLKSYGIDATKGALEAAGNASAAMGKPLMQSVEALADAMTGENERLKEFGITTKKMGDQIAYLWQENGKTMGAKAKSGSQAQIQAVIQGIWNRRYPGAMDKLSHTWDGLTSNLSDQWTKFLQVIGSSGVFDWLKGKVQGLLDKLNEMEKSGALKALAEKISKLLVGVFERLWKFIEHFNVDDFLTGLDNLAIRFNQLAGSVGGTENLLIGIFALFNASTLASILAIAVAIGGIGIALTKAAWAFTALLAANPVLLAVTAAVGLLAWGGYELWRDWDKIKAGVLAAWGDIGDGASIWQRLGRVIGQVGYATQVAMAFASGAVLAAAAKILPALARLAVGFYALVAANPVLTAIIAAVGLLAWAGFRLWQDWDKIKAGLLAGWADIKDGAGIWDAVTRTVQNFGTATSAALALASGAIVAALGRVAVAFAGLALANPVLAAIIVAVAAVAVAGYQLWKNWDIIKAALLKIWADTKDAAQGVWEAMKQGFTDLWNAPRLAAEQFFTWMDGKLESMRGIAERVGGFFGAGTGGSAPAASIPANIAALADSYAGRYEIPPELLRRLIQAESGGNPDIVSPKGAMGLMQLMPATAKRFGVRNPFDPAQNLAGGTAYLSYLLDRYGGNQAKALAAYNAGEGNVDKYGGVPPFRETQDYVNKILGAGRQNITGDVRVRFENAPAGMRVEPQRQSGPLTITPEVGYRGFATGMP